VSLKNIKTYHIFRWDREAHDNGGDQTALILKMQSVRVYGSHSRYGEEPQQNPHSEPIIVKDFPCDGEVVEVLLGEPPKISFEAHRRKMALANVVLDINFGRRTTISEEYTFDDAIRDQLANEHTVPVLKNYSWYVTISIQRDIEVNDEFITESEFPLAKIPDGTKFREFQDYATPYINHIASIVSTVVGTEFFENVLFDEVLFSGANGIVTRLPEFQDFKMSGRMSVSSPTESFDLPGLRALLTSERLQRYAKNGWLESVVHWHSATLNEPDHWKAFQYAFLTLEILIHKVNKRLYSNVRDSFAFKLPDGELLVRLPMADLLGSEDRLSLLAKFCVMSLGLSPSTADADIRAFKNAKDARDRFSHGDIRDESDLPLHTVRDLSTRYLEAVFRASWLS
jgi:hypothetical protein